MDNSNIKLNALKGLYFIRIRIDIISQNLPKNTAYEIPHGSILGPLLILLYSNAMPKSQKYVALLMYEDCTEFSASSKHGDEIKGRPTQPKINLFEISIVSVIVFELVFL